MLHANQFQFTIGNQLRWHFMTAKKTLIGFTQTALFRSFFYVTLRPSMQLELNCKFASVWKISKYKIHSMYMNSFMSLVLMVSIEVCIRMVINYFASDASARTVHHKCRLRWPDFIAFIMDYVGFLIKFFLYIFA